MGIEEALRFLGFALLPHTMYSLGEHFWELEKELSIEENVRQLEAVVGEKAPKLPSEKWEKRKTAIAWVAHLRREKRIEGVAYIRMVFLLERVLRHGISDEMVEDVIEIFGKKRGDHEPPFCFSALVDERAFRAGLGIILSEKGFNELRVLEIDFPDRELLESRLKQLGWTPLRAPGEFVCAPYGREVGRKRGDRDNRIINRSRVRAYLQGALHTSLDEKIYAYLRSKKFEGAEGVLQEAIFFFGSYLWGNELWMVEYGLQWIWVVSQLPSCPPRIALFDALERMAELEKLAPGRATMPLLQIDHYFDRSARLWEEGSWVRTFLKIGNLVLDQSFYVYVLENCDELLGKGDYDAYSAVYNAFAGDHFPSTPTGLVELIGLAPPALEMPYHLLRVGLHSLVKRKGTDPLLELGGFDYEAFTSAIQALTSSS